MSVEKKDEKEVKIKRPMNEKNKEAQPDRKKCAHSTRRNHHSPTHTSQNSCWLLLCIFFSIFPESGISSEKKILKRGKHGLFPLMGNREEQERKKELKRIENKLHNAQQAWQGYFSKIVDTRNKERVEGSMRFCCVVCFYCHYVVIVEKQKTGEKKRRRTDDYYKILHHAFPLLIVE